MTKIPYKIYLTEDEMPKKWLNLRAFMKNKPEPIINPGTKQPCTLDELSHIFCTELAKQELNVTDKYIEIPEEIQSFYKMYRPSPLVRAYNLEKALGTPAEIYYKFEGTNTSGSHKLNSAAAQVYYAKEQGITKLTTETGAGQWGTALSMACAFYGVDLSVYMVKVSSQQKPYRKAVIETYGAKVIPSPSDTTEVGRKILAENPETGGSLGCAISEATEVAMKTENCRYVLGSVLNHVLMHQSVIGLESKTALDKYGIKPDIIIGCAGGGSNLGGLIAPFMAEKIEEKNDIKFIAVEPASCPSLTRGKYAYDFGDTGKQTPLMKMYTLGSGFMPSPNHAGGLRYHGMSTVISKLYDEGYIDAVSVEQTKVFDAAVMFAKTEGTLPAPESSHAIRAAVDEALKCKKTGEKKTILFGLTGTGYFDMSAYQSYLNGTMTDYIPTDEELQKGFDTLPEM
ncbi:TrpB-like pyridoxal phosphate-dependent enzyme [Qingrenia yutianensis]|uniref:tryptophan synthase n=1 Tax=Qingrenia yutianensis TaxID=2763676 RepID=A0A926FF26_9FIRM|nr:TrpB-like pyridoxal phosphate-dependent enzyme [Qingrenia yutianensis]MBC8597099.1 TrpB-like pyridoxal phosphate-dependent enzyme [Qingrenia yutianensis]